MESETLDVDGERFVVRRRSGSPGTYDLDWVTGPNEGYGFSSSTSDQSPLTWAQLERSARDFLADIDPETGFID